MKRVPIHLVDVACREQLAWAFWRAALGKRHRPEVQRFAARLDANLDRLAAEILAGTVEVGRFHCFEIRDPKRRIIHAPYFRERVLHHALMAQLEPVIDRYLVAATYACRLGKGNWAAVQRAQEQARRWPWFLKLDVRSYFASIDHAVLKRQIRRRIKGAGVLDLVDRIIDSHRAAPGKGLPIGALTSQHFANLYLTPFDRYLLEDLRVPGFVRYMDDSVVWHRDRTALRQVLEAGRAFAAERLRLEIKPTWQLQRSSRGLSLCGYRIDRHRLWLTARRRRRYRQVRAKWESAYRAGRISACALQAGYASALAMTLGTDAAAWRRRQLETYPPVDA